MQRVAKWHTVGMAKRGGAVGVVFVAVVAAFTGYTFAAARFLF